MHHLYSILFSPEGGGWGYPFLGLPGVVSLVIAAGMVPLSLLVLRAAMSTVERHEWRSLSGLMCFGFAAQLALRWLAPTSMAAVVESRGANGFLEVARSHSATELLSRFSSIAGQAPMHVRANLPGKTLLYQFLLTVTDSSAVMAVFLVLLSTAGAALVYLLARVWFEDRRVGIVAAMFYMLVPARIYFLPGLNVVTPVFLLISLVSIEYALATRRYPLLVAAGISLYGLVIFEPLPLAAGLIVVAQVARRIARGDVGIGWVARGAGGMVVGVLAAHSLMWGLFRFDVVQAFASAWADARTFNAVNHRPYGLWVVHNLKDFLIHMGLAQSTLWLAHLGNDLTVSWVGWSTLATLLALAAIGVNRGEVVRLWLFLGMFVQIAAARAAVHRPRVAEAALAVSIVQAAILSTSIGWYVL